MSATQWLPAAAALLLVVAFVLCAALGRLAGDAPAGLSAVSRRPSLDHPGRR